MPAADSVLRSAAAAARPSTLPSTPTVSPRLAWLASQSRCEGAVPLGILTSSMPLPTSSASAWTQ